MSNYQRPPAWAYQMFSVQSFEDKVIATAWAWRGGPVAVNSWYRDPPANRREGGDRFSQHLIGLAGDFQPQPGEQGQLVSAFRAQGLLAFPSGGAVHVQLRRAGYLEGWLRRNGYVA